jgi:ABC-type multidrug transport system ATPase subunit
MTPIMTPIITANSVSKVYKKNFRSIHALENVSFDVPPNHILGILGPNGAGKTTLLKILTGIIPQGRFTGNIRIFDTENTGSIKHKIGFLPEQPEFFKNVTAY